MDVRSLTRTSLMAAVLYVVFESFTNVLYLELITFSLFVFAQVFDRKEVTLASALFALLYLLLHGIMIWNIAYCLIFPSYAWCFGLLRNMLSKHQKAIPFVTALFSFLIGQLVDLPFLLLDERATIFYLIMGIKTSLIQGCLTFLVTLFLYEPVCDTLKRIRNQMR